MSTKIMFLSLLVLIILALLFYFAYDSNTGGFFRTATPTMTITLIPTQTSKPAHLISETVTPETPSLTPTATPTPTYTPTATNTLAPLWTPTKKSGGGNDGGGGVESCPPGYVGIPPDCIWTGNP